MLETSPRHLNHGADVRHSAEQQRHQGGWDDLGAVWDYLAGVDVGAGVDAPGTLAPSPRLAAAIVCLGSANLGTARRGARLFHAGVAPRVVVSGGVAWRTPAHDTEADAFAHELVEWGVPPAAIVRERRASNTGENARLALEALERTGVMPRRIVVVAFPTLIRRAVATFSLVRPSLVVDPVPAFDDLTAFEGTSRRAIELVCAEVERLRTYPQRGLIRPVEVPTWVLEATGRLRREVCTPDTPEGRDFPYRHSANCDAGA